MTATMTTFKVGTFWSADEDTLTRSAIRCYTQLYNSRWKGCVEIVVEAKTGAAAKKAARELRFIQESEKAALVAKETKR